MRHAKPDIEMIDDDRTPPNPSTERHGFALLLSLEKCSPVSWLVCLNLFEQAVTMASICCQEQFLVDIALIQLLLFWTSCVVDIKTQLTINLHNMLAVLTPNRTDWGQWFLVKRTATSQGQEPSYPSVHTHTPARRHTLQIAVRKVSMPHAPMKPKYPKA